MFFEHKVGTGIQKKPPESRMFLQDVTPLPRFEYKMLIQMLTPLDVSESKPGTEKF